MRLPGTIKWKYGTRAAIVSHNPAYRVDVNNLIKVLPDAGTVADPRSVAMPDVVSSACCGSDASAYVQKFPSAGEGDRNNAAYRLAAALTHDFGLSLEQAWPFMQAWNSRCTPPLEDNELAECLRNGSGYAKGPQGPKQPRGQGKQLILICEQELVDAFLDQFGQPYVGLPCAGLTGHIELCQVDSTRFSNWLALRYYERFGKPPGSQALGQARLHAGAVCATKPRRTLSRRVLSYPDGTIWYDLGTEEWHGVHLAPNGWAVGALPPLFRRSTHQLPQVMPVPGGDPRTLLRFCNVQSDDECLFMVLVASFFIPAIPHPPLIQVGPPGTGKTRMMAIIKSLVDPSAVTCLAPPQNEAAAEHLFGHHYLIPWDNLSVVSQWFSDALCRFCTGGGGSKRALFSNDGDFVRTYQGCLILNSVGNVCYRPDLVDRSVIVQTAPLQNPIDERRYQAMWQEHRPHILGGFFDVVCRALGMTMEWPGKLPRMADFSLWGMKLAEAMGYGANTFVQAYEQAIADKWVATLADNSLANWILDFLTQVGGSWRGTTTQLLQQIPAELRSVRGMPETAVALGRELNQLTPALGRIGIACDRKRHVWVLQHQRTRVVQAAPIPQMG
jgi:hypothetical protein